MGPAIFKKKWGETTYALRILPIGGFCSMEGEDEKSDDEHSFNKKPVWQRMIVAFAGAFTNIVTGFLIMLILTATSPVFGTTTVDSFGQKSTSDKPSSVSQSCLKVGDEIIKINGSRVHISRDIMYDLMLDNDNVVSMQVKRDGKIIDLDKVTFPMVDAGNGQKIMSMDFLVTQAPKNVGTVIREGFYETISMVRLVWLTFISLFNGRFGLNDLAGPIGTTQAVSTAASQGAYSLFFVAAMIAVNLGVVNLFPLPALDGGMLLMLIVEAIRKKPVNPKYQGYVNLVGFALLMLLMLVVSYNDILRLIKG